MSKIKKFIDSATLRALVALAGVVSLTAFVSANDLCVYWFHQPKMPDAVRKLKK